MIVLESLALLLIAIYTVLRARLGPQPRKFLIRSALLVITSWIAEDTVIVAYGFYAYSPEWTVFVHKVPLAVILIWPCVIHSQWDICRYLFKVHDSSQPAEESRATASTLWLVPLSGGAMVLADASLIEPIAVQSKLWWWYEPGLFEVPPIGIIGWAILAALCLAVFERCEQLRRPLWFNLAIILIAPVGTHLFLLALWWGALRWVSTELSPWPFVALVWAISIALTIAAVRTRAKERVPPSEMWTRVPPALYFLVLLVLFGRHVLPLVLYALAFAPPYIALTRWPRGRRKAANPTGHPA